MSGRGGPKQTSINFFFPRGSASPAVAGRGKSAQPASIAASSSSSSRPPSAQPPVTPTIRRTAAFTSPAEPPSSSLSAAPVSGRTPQSFFSTPSSSSSLFPASQTCPSAEERKELLQSPDSGRRKRKQINYAEVDDEGGDDEDAPILRPAARAAAERKKRGRRIVEDDDGDDEYQPDQDVEAELSDAVMDDNMEVMEGEEEEEERKDAAPRSRIKKAAAVSASTVVKPRSLSFPPKASSAPAASSDSSDQRFTFPQSVVQRALYADLTADPNASAPKPQPSSSDSGAPAKFDGSFLHPDKIRDAQGRRPSDPEYDASTLLVPNGIKLTPGQRQYFDIKSHCFDVLLFYKMGKFYELYDRDADIGVRELGLTYMVNQTRPHAGFPEAAFDKYAAMAVNAGHKVGVVEQVQTPKMRAEANKTKKGKDKVKTVDRELTGILTPGTLRDLELIGSYESRYFVSLRERELDEAEVQQRAEAGERTALGGEIRCELGVCFLDAACGRFHVGQFFDDEPRSQLSTLLATINPQEVCIPAGCISERTEVVLRCELSARVLQSMLRLKDEDEFMSAAATYDWIESKPYFRQLRPVEGGPEVEREEDAEIVWPEELMQLWSLRAELAFSALGGCLWTLEKYSLARDLMTQRNFSLYTPSTAGLAATRLVLDNQTLVNLEIFKDSEGGKKAALLSHVDRCVSAMGHRLMRRWLASPLASARAIDDRLNAVAFLISHTEQLRATRQLLASLPDVERLSSQLHSYSLRRERAAIMYGNQEQKKMQQFVSVLNGLQRAVEIRTRLWAGLSREKLQSAELSSCTVQFPHCEAPIAAFQACCDDWDAAVRDGCVKPNASWSGYSAAVEQEAAASQALDDYLLEVRRELRCKDVKYVAAASSRYCLNVPANVKVPPSFTLVSGSKTWKRYHTPSITDKLLRPLEDAELAKEKIEKEATRELFGRFVSHQQLWRRAAQALATLDCLCALAVVSADQQTLGHSVRPQLLSWEEQQTAVLELRDCIHPVLARLQTGGQQFIPNDTVMGDAECPARFVLLSGANMGGKTTLLRQVCIAVILAQMGCWVPASAARFTPVDRVFTRCGAGDRIMQGQSTFLVELQETATILHNASARSLVILDELGRGTSTFDGVAVAEAVLEFMRQRIDCLCLFSTHYHSLISQYEGRQHEVALYHMAVAVEEGEEQQRQAAAAGGSGGREDVTFLYSYRPGASPKSYGLNVALKAGLSPRLVQRAKEVSDMHEGSSREQALWQTARTRRHSTTAAAAAAAGAQLPARQRLSGGDRRAMLNDFCAIFAAQSLD